MDQIKIGNFIAEKRKEKNLTQEQLAEKIGVSNKTISKWECGRCMPDYSMIEGLCKELRQHRINQDTVARPKKGVKKSKFSPIQCSQRRTNSDRRP